MVERPGLREHVEAFLSEGGGQVLEHVLGQQIDVLHHSAPRHGQRATARGKRRNDYSIGREGQLGGECSFVCGGCARVTRSVKQFDTESTSIKNAAYQPLRLPPPSGPAASSS
jgi:hypothetical protein